MNLKKRNRRSIKRATAFTLCIVMTLTMYPLPLLAQQSQTPKTTNPAKHDTDGDGFLDGPDAWIDMGGAGLWLRAGEDKNGNGKYEPEGVDGILGTKDDETDPNDPTSHPEGNSVLDMDSDRDGLSNNLEKIVCTYDYDSDSDDDGISDVDEVFGFINAEDRSIYLPKHAQWARRCTNPMNADTDGDGLPDGLEMGVTQTGSGYSDPGRNDYNNEWYDDISIESRYLPDEYELDINNDPILQSTFVWVDAQSIPTISDSLVKDSNHNGILDGLEDSDRDGVVDSGETDPGRGIVNLPHPRGWNSEEFALSLRTDVWHSVVKVENSQDIYAFNLSILPFDEEYDDVTITGRFGLNLGVSGEPLTLQNNSSQIDLSIQGEIYTSTISGEKWTPVTFEGNQNGAVSISICVLDSYQQTSTLIDQGIFNNYTVKQIEDLIPCVETTYLDNVNSTLKQYLIQEVFGELIGEALQFAAALALGVGASVAAPLLIIGAIAYQIEFFVVKLPNAMKLFTGWIQAMETFGWPYGVSDPSEYLVKFAGASLSDNFTLRSVNLKNLHDLYFKTDMYRVFGIPHEWTVEKSVEIGLFNAFGQLDWPLRQVEYVYSDNFLTWTMDAARLYKGMGAPECDVIIPWRVSPVCIDLEQEEIDAIPRSILGVAVFSDASNPELENQTQRIRLSSRTSFSSSISDPYDDPPIENFGNRNKGYTDVDIAARKRGGGVI